MRFIDSLKIELQKPLHDSIKVAHYFDIANDYWLYHEDSMDVALDYIHNCIAVSQKIQNYYWETSAYNLLGKIHKITEDLDASIDAFEKAMDISLKNNDSLRYIMYKDNSADVIIYQGDFTRGLEIKKEALDYFVAKNDSIAICSNLYGHGFLYQEKGDYKDAIPFYKKSLLFGPNWELLHSEVFSSLGIMYRDLDQIDSAFVYFLKAAELNKNVPSIYALNTFEYGLLFEKTNQIDSALYYVNQAIITKGQDPKSEIFNLFKVQQARLLSEKGSINRAINIYEKALPYIENTTNVNYKRDLYDAGYKIFNKMGDDKNALKYFLKFSEVQDSIDNVEKEKNFADIETKYETEKKAQEIATLHLQDELNQTHLSNQRSWIWALGIGMAALLFLMQRIFSQNKKINAQKEKISAALKDRTTLLKEIHHRVKNNLQVVSSLLFLQSRYVEDDTALDAIKTGRARVQSMSILHQKLYSNDDLKSVNMKTYFEDLGSNLFDTYSMDDKNIEFISEIDDLELDVDTVVPLGLITNELISNSLKHAFKDQKDGQIKLSLKSENGKLVLSVSDNGSSIDFTEIPEKSKSLGLQLIKSFVVKLKADLKIDNTNGTKFTLSFIPSQNLEKVA